MPMKELATISMKGKKQQTKTLKSMFRTTEWKVITGKYETCILEIME